MSGFTKSDREPSDSFESVRFDPRPAPTPLERDTEVFDREPANLRWLAHPALCGLNNSPGNDLRSGVSSVEQFKQAQCLFVGGAKALDILRPKCRILQQTINGHGIPLDERTVKQGAARRSS
jgi:hypothetical protein